MFAKGTKQGTVQFSIQPPEGAVQVYLAGGFRAWKPLPMRKRNDGRFALELPLAPGTHEYKFIIDGRWTADPDHAHRAKNPYDSFNSVAEVR